jgi:hypothetical protein
MASASEPCETDKLTAGFPGDNFGSDVDVSGNVAIVGGFWADAAYIYRRIDSDWVEEAVLIIEDSRPADLFGKSVAIRGDVAVVGAPGDDENGVLAGAAYVFRFHAASSTWVQEAKLLASDGALTDFFGSSVAISGEKVAIGAPLEGDVAGAVYVFRYDGSTWIEEVKLIAEPPATTPGVLGASVAIDGDVVIAGALGDDSPAQNAGSAYVFRFNGSARGAGGQAAGRQRR